MRKTVVPIVLSVLMAAMAGPVPGQTFPNHVDPRGREVVPDLGAVATLRFLTTPDFPPFNYRDGDGDLIGYHIDLAEALCARLSARCTIQAWPWDDVADALAEGQGDALIAGLALTPEHGARFDFSRIYMALPARFVTLRDAAADFAPQAPGGVVAVRAGSAHQRFLETMLPDVALRAFPSEIAALQAVEAGQAVAFFGDAMRAAFWLNENAQCCSFAGAPYFRPDWFGPGLAIAFAPGQDGAREALDWALVRLQQEGRLDELYLRWFPVSFY